MHVIAAKAVCFKEALQPEFKVYQQQIIEQRTGTLQGTDWIVELRSYPVEQTITSCS